MNPTKAYYNIDGVGELGMGFMCLSFAAMQWMQLRSPEHSFWNQPYTFLVFILALSGIIHYGSKAIKNRITYPRTGFVEYRKRDTVWVPMILAAGTSAGIAVLLAMATRHHWHLGNPASLIGLLFAGTYAYGFARTVPWKWIVAMVMAAASVLMAVLPPGRIAAIVDHSWVTRLFPAKTVGGYWITIALYGALLFLSGAISFVLYLRYTKEPGEAA